MTCINASLIPLLPRLADSDAKVRRIAIIELADLEEPDALPLLIERLQQDPDAEVRAEAARYLAGWDDAEVVQALAQALSDPAEPVRQLASHSLTELKQPDSGQQLLPWLDTESPFIQASILRALRELRLPAAASPARLALNSTDERVRREAVGLLGWLKHEPALPELAQLALTDPALEVRKAATGALGLGFSSATSAAAQLLVQILADPAWQVREEAAATLGKLAFQPALNRLIDRLQDSYWQVRLQATRALGRLKNPAAGAALEALLRHEISNLRKEAALALGELQDPARIPALQQALADPDPEVRKAVRIALTQLAACEA